MRARGGPMRTADIRVRRAIAAMAAGRPIVVSDDTSAEADGHLVFAAEAATPKLLAFTVRHTSGYVRVALPGTECERLNLPPLEASTIARQGEPSARIRERHARQDQ